MGVIIIAFCSSPFSHLRCFGFFSASGYSASLDTGPIKKKKKNNVVPISYPDTKHGGKKTQVGKCYLKLPWAFQIRLHCVPLQKLYKRNLFHTWHSSLSSSCCSLLIWEHQFSPSSMFTPGHTTTTPKSSQWPQQNQSCALIQLHILFLIGSAWSLKYWVHYTEPPVRVWSFDYWLGSPISCNRWRQNTERNAEVVLMPRVRILCFEGLMGRKMRRNLKWNENQNQAFLVCASNSWYRRRTLPFKSYFESRCYNSFPLWPR